MMKIMNMQEYEEEFEDYSGSEAQLHFWFGLIWTDLELGPMVERFWKCKEFALESLKSSCYPRTTRIRITRIIRIMHVAGSCIMLLCGFEHFELAMWMNCMVCRFCLQFLFDLRDLPHVAVAAVACDPKQNDPIGSEWGITQRCRAR